MGVFTRELELLLDKVIVPGDNNLLQELKENLNKLKPHGQVSQRNTVISQIILSSDWGFNTGGIQMRLNSQPSLFLFQTDPNCQTELVKRPALFFRKFINLLRKLNSRER